MPFGSQKAIANFGRPKITVTSLGDDAFNLNAPYEANNLMLDPNIFLMMDAMFLKLHSKTSQPDLFSLLDDEAMKITLGSMLQVCC